jgi:23S rRNA pseudouridine2604 synthase
MCEALGYRVVRLKRTRIMNILLGDLKEGTYRDVTPEEKNKLYQLTQHSYSAPKGSTGKKRREP